MDKKCSKHFFLPYEQLEVTMKFNHVQVLGTYINDHSKFFTRICQITTYTAYVMLIESGRLVQTETKENDRAWMSQAFKNSFINKGFALLAIGEQALILYCHDDRWYLYNASTLNLAKWLLREYESGARPLAGARHAVSHLMALEDVDNPDAVRSVLRQRINYEERKSA